MLSVMLKSKKKLMVEVGRLPQASSQLHPHLKNDLMSFILRMFDLVFRNTVSRKAKIKVIKICVGKYQFSEMNTENFGSTTRVIILKRLLYPPRTSKARSAVSNTYFL